MVVRLRLELQPLRLEGMGLGGHQQTLKLALGLPSGVKDHLTTLPILGFARQMSQAPQKSSLLQQQQTTQITSPLGGVLSLDTQQSAR